MYIQHTQRDTRKKDYSAVQQSLTCLCSLAVETCCSSSDCFFVCSSTSSSLKEGTSHNRHNRHNTNLHITRVCVCVCVCVCVKVCIPDSSEVALRALYEKSELI